MDNRFYDNEFEKYLKEEADDYRMYPSDHVWRNIQQEIHGYRKWPALTAIAIIVISALVVGTILVKPNNQIATVTKPETTNIATAKEPASTTSIEKNNIEKPKSVNTYLAAIEKPVEETSNNLNSLTTGITEITKQAFNTNSAVAEIISEPSESLLDKAIIINIKPNYEIAKSSDIKQVLNASVIPEILSKQNTTLKVTEPAETKESILSSTNKTASAFFNLNAQSFAEKNLYEKNDFKNQYLFANNEDLQNGFNNSKNLSFVFNNHKKNNAENSPLSKLSGGSSKFDFQFYVTPSISYRRLVDNVNGELSKSYITALPFAANYVVDVNHVIKHMPARGYEVGFSLGYNLSNKFAIRSGFQFNLRQYDINAFVHPFEAATIALLTGNTNSFVNTVSGFRNIPGSTPIILTNRYYEISMPIGVDWKPISGKISWGIAGSVQPTYTFDKEPFIITSNYKNYADGSQLLHNWNVNANIETYIGYSAGKYRWQLGPQVRYQAMPTMSKAYPIREYLIDYGVKLSLTRLLK